MTEQVSLSDPVRSGAAGAVRRSRRADWWFYSLLGLASLGLMYVASLPGWPLIWLTPVLLLWLAVGLVWLVRLITAIQRRSFSLPPVVAPVVALGMAVLFLSPLPLQARFALSRPAFDQEVRSLPLDKGQGGSLGLVGSYRIARWSRAADGVLFDEANGTGVGERAGFAYLPKGVPETWTQPDPDLPGPHVIAWQELAGSWYSWEMSSS